MANTAYDDQQQDSDNSTDSGQQYFDREFGNITRHYNDETAPNNPASGLGQQENSAVNSSQKGGSQPLSPGNLKNAEGSPKGGNDTLGRGFQPDKQGEGGKAKEILKAIRKGGRINSKGARRLGIGGILIVGAIVGVGSIVPRQLNAIQKIVEKEAAKIERSVEKKVARTTMQTIVLQLAKKQNATAAEKQRIAQEEARARANGQTLAVDAANYPLASEQVQQNLAREGIRVEVDANGNFRGLRDIRGRDITRLIGADELVFDDFDRAMPAGKVGEIELFRRLDTLHAGSSFNIFPADGSRSGNVRRTLADAVARGASAEEISRAGQTTEERRSPSNQNDPRAQGAFDEQNQRSQLIREVTAAANENFRQTFDNAQAEQAGMSAARKFIGKTDKPLFLSSIVTMGCTVQEAARIAVDDRTIATITLLIRDGDSLRTLSAGKLSGKTVQTIMKMYQANPSLFSQDKSSEGAMQFTRAAAWRRATNTPVNTNPASPNYTPDLPPSASPNKKGAIKLVKDIQTMLNITGGGLACGALTSDFGIVLQLGLGAVQIISNLGSFGATQATVLASGFAFNEYLTRIVIPEMVRYFSNLSITGTEIPVHQINNKSAGLHLAYSNYGRRLGGVPQTNQQVTHLKEVAQAEEDRMERGRPWAYRTFSLDNPSSFATRLLLQVPLGIPDTMASITSYLSGFPLNIFHQAASIFQPRALFADNASGCADPYCVTAHVPDATYPMLENEQYLFSTVSYGDKSVRRIDALGDPAKYVDTIEGDPNNNDLLHCFVNGYDKLANLSDNSNEDAKANCGSIGTYDMNEPNPTNLPTDDTIAIIYCKALLTGTVSLSDVPRCVNQVRPQVSDDLNHFRSHLIYVQTMKNYMSLTKVTNG